MAPDAPVTDAAGAAVPSLRRTLLTWLVLPLLLLVPLAAAAIYMLALQPALDSLDRALTDTVVALSRILEAPGDRPMLPLSAQTEHALKADLVDEVVFAVGDARGGLLSGEPSLLALGVRPARDQWRFFDAPLHGHAVRVAAFGAPCGSGTCPVLVAESLRKRAAASRAVMLAALVASLMLAMCLAVLAWVAVARALIPLRQASGELSRRSMRQLEPLSLAQLPREVRFLGAAINDLFERLHTAIGAQRRFLDDASHQLRTPLAVMLSESAQALAQPHPAELDERLQRLHAAAERGAQLSHQLLTLARAQGTTEGRPLSHEPLDLVQLITDAAAEWVRPALDAGQELEFALAPARVRGEAWMLRELMGNLVHNAQLHAGAGAQVFVRTRTESGWVVLEVEDTGPGLPEVERARAWDRFYRGRGAQGRGTGLGLPIVQHIAQLHGGRAELHAGTSGNGLLVRIELPAA